MLVEFFQHLRTARLPVSITEYLALMEALHANVANYSVDNFYYLSRAILVKDERHLDRFDRVFGACFKGRMEQFEQAVGDLPEEWLRKQAELLLTEEERRRIESLGGFEQLMETLRKRLQEQRDRHQGGAKWIGTAGKSPFGAYGYNPEGVRIGQDDNRNHRAAKVWDRREFRDLDDGLAIGVRNLQVALRKLRKFAREGSPEVLDLDATISNTARNAGWLDVRMVPERHNAIKVLLFFDVGGSMFPHVEVCERLFSAARSEFRHLEYFYFHNFFYDSVWRSNRRRRDESVSFFELFRTYGPDYRVIVVGDASMSPYEIAAAGGSVEFWNEEPGEVWARRLLEHWSSAVWLNPAAPESWNYTHSIAMIRKIMDDRMFPLTVSGLEDAIACLKGGGARRP
ncbi:MAG: VWA domain-containing protein [Proteobacteria bacterium]|nr:MAG: VWA domain-containing protein [Pseudomonadota bacterium]